MNKLKCTLLLLANSIFSLPLMSADHSVISADKIKWGLLNPLRGEASPKAADLWGDRTKDMATGMLVKFNKGFSSPPHIHNITYRGVVIEGLLHNDDPTAEKMWLGNGSFWTQPAGESHITAAEGEENLIYIEIDNGPYLVHPAKNAFDNGERPINIEASNLVWLDAKDLKWIENNKVQKAHLWGNPQHSNGSFLKLPSDFRGTIESSGNLKAVVVRGEVKYWWNDKKTETELSPGGFFSSETAGEHRIETKSELVLYINSETRYKVK